MARNLYDLGDTPQREDAWLSDRAERRGSILPRRALALALLLGGLGLLLFRNLWPDPDATKAVSATTIIQSFAACDDPAGEACVLGPDSYALHGHRYRVADIVAPSLAAPHCPQEAEVAAQGRAALLALMNGGAFDARHDPFDGSARLLSRDGVSLGSLMVLKGFARPTGSGAVDWCAAG